MPPLMPQPNPDFLAHAIHTMIFGFAFFVALVVGLIVAVRFIVLWYFKLDRIERHLSEIAAELKRRAPPLPPDAEPKP